MMKLRKLIRAYVAACLTALLTLSFGQTAAAAPQQEVSAQPAQAAPQQQSARTNAAGSDTSGAVVSRNTAQSGTPRASQSGSQAQQNGAAKPVGTAAAPDEETTGVAASRPAGAAIAPAKQRRVRSFLIKFGVVVGAAVAVGTVAALSQGSPSRPH